MRKSRSLGWFWFYSGKESVLEELKCGKWMYFFSDQSVALEICEKAMKENVCYECKCTDMETTGTPQGVICFFLNGDDFDNHRRVIEFMLRNNMIRKTKAGKYYNISFKFNLQTYSGEYGSDFKGIIKLGNFINLETGEWLLK